MTNTQTNSNEPLNAHLSIPFENRDINWELRFFDLFVTCHLSVEEDPQPGPDGLVYLLVETEQTEDCAEPAVQVLDWLSDKGIGLVVNPRKDYPDYVFSYGMLWHFREFQRFVNPSANLQSHGAFQIQSQSLTVGQPNPDYLPRYVRGILREFLNQQSVLQPRVCMLSEDGENYDLAFSIESLGKPPEKEHDGILEALSWFMPPHYSLALVSEADLPKAFQPL